MLIALDDRKCLVSSDVIQTNSSIEAIRRQSKGEVDISKLFGFREVDGIGQRAEEVTQVTATLWQPQQRNARLGRRRKSGAIYGINAS